MRVRRSGVRGHLLVWLAVAVAAAGLPGVARARATPTLAREVTLSAAGSGWVHVRLARPVSFGKSGQPEVVRVSDPAAFVGVVLVREQRGAWPPGVGVMALPDAGGLKYGHTFFGHERGSSAPDDDPVIFRRTLPAGTYRLYLLTRAAAKVTVTVRFPVAAGRRAFTIPRNTTHHDTTSVSPGVPGTAVSPTHSHSATFALRRRGLLLNLAWWRGDISAEHQSGSCAYSGSAADPGPAVPSCPNGPGAVVGGHEVEQPAARTTIGYLYVSPARWLHKTYFVVGGHVRNAGIALYWLDLGAGFPAA